MSDANPDKIQWLIDETTPISTQDLKNLEEKADALSGTRSGYVPTLALCLHNIRILNTRKWFGEADIRLDALIFTGQMKDDTSDLYIPRTASFPRVRDGDELPIDKGGLLVFHGEARYFLDLMILVSRDRRDTEDLATLMADGLKTDGKANSAVGTLLEAAISPQATAFKAAVDATLILGEFACRLLRKATGSTIGLYRNTFLETRDDFGIGRHPGPNRELFNIHDLEFRYEINEE